MEGRNDGIGDRARAPGPPHHPPCDDARDRAEQEAAAEPRERRRRVTEKILLGHHARERFPDDGRRRVVERRYPAHAGAELPEREQYTDPRYEHPPLRETGRC